VAKLLGLSVVLGVLVALSPDSPGTLAGLIVASAVAAVSVVADRM